MHACGEAQGQGLRAGVHMRKCRMKYEDLLFSDLYKWRLDPTRNNNKGLSYGNFVRQLNYTLRLKVVTMSLEFQILM